jgi:hypothetical protein
VVTFGGTDVHSIPPVSYSSTPDINDDSANIYPMNQAELAVWTGSSGPTAQQCLNVIRTQSSGAEVRVTIGTIVCALTSENTLAIIRVTAIDTNDIGNPMQTQTTIYAA